MDNYKTIKELAEELGFSKAYIDKTIRLLSMHTELTKLGNKYVITKKQEKAIKQAIAEKKSHTESHTESHTSMHTESNTVGEVFFLRNQLENKNIELEKMQKLLDQQQQLTLQANKQIEQLQSQLLLTNTTNQEEDSWEEEDTKKKILKKEVPSKKWFQFWR